MITIPPYIDGWFKDLQALTMHEAVPEPSRACVFSSDMITGFLSTGNLASERTRLLAQPVTEVFRKAYRRGVRHFVLFQDAHDPDAPEFKAFPPHCIRESHESSTIPELLALPFSGLFTIIEKNSLSAAMGTGFDRWLDAHEHINRALVVGNCTDLCVYQLAMHLRLWANARNNPDYQVIVPVNAVDTYDLTEDEARRAGAFPHPGDFFHRVFLYHMAINGIRIARELTE
jgi:nicotinamidase-related amidase